MPNYYKSIAVSVVRLIGQGYKVHFFSTCQGIDYYDDDNKVVDKILALIPDTYYSDIVKYDRYLSIPEIMELLKQMDLIIATRLHMSILSLISGTPVYPIAYEFKTIELYQTLEYKSVDTLESVDPLTLPTKIFDFINSFTTSRRNDIYSKVAEHITNSMKVASLIK